MSRRPALRPRSVPAPAVVRRARPRGLLVTALAAGAAAWGAACGGESSPPSPPPPAAPPVSASGVPTFAVRVARVLPHDPGAFTEGLFFHDGQLYESTGLEGQSDIRRVDLATGAVQQRVALPAPYFGEGTIIVGDRLYQLTWKHNRAFVYDARTFVLKDTLGYTGEGWGLTYDGESIVMSDGTARLRFLDPATFAVRRTIDVKDGMSPVSQLNELEWVKGEILANVWQSDQIARIDPRTGNVTGWIDATGLLPAGDRTPQTDVMNGIAYDARTDRLYVTGKYWPKLFEITLAPR